MTRTKQIVLGLIGILIVIFLLVPENVKPSEYIGGDW